MKLIVQSLPNQIARPNFPAHVGIQNSNLVPGATDDSVVDSISTLFHEFDRHGLEELTHGTSQVKEFLPFVLATFDFGVQNMLCDPDTGAITAILEWDLTETRPRYTGWAIPPCWLLKDYWGSYCHPIEGKSMHTKEYDRYRQAYAHYLREVCAINNDEVDDWKYTCKGPIFEQIVNSITDGDPLSIERCAKFVTGEIYSRTDIDGMMEKVLTNDLRQGMKG